MQEYSIVVLPEDAGKRLDIYLADYSRQQDLGLSRQAVQKLILQGAISLKNLDKPKPHYKIKGGDEIRIAFEEKKESALEAEDIPLEVVYEDKDLAIIDKPIGMVVHPAPGNYTHTLVNGLLHRFTELSDINPLRPGIVHRLDKDTSGLLVIAKNNPSHLNLAKQFSEHSILRKYVALVSGEVKFNEDVIELPIGRHPTKRKSMAVGFSDQSKFAKTRYRTLKRTKELSLLELEPFTGRTHQLRVHLAFLGHPILGDTKYGRNNAFSRLALHAKYLGFIHPSTHKFIEFSSETPVEFLKAIEKNKS
ncbi:MAG: RluA family pseudouridine synthase [Candidatus Omnitrophica bacterium]|nr:RluA family pseudouridine synthase [Candidatus Omnitrophota bacterium]